MRRTAAQIAVTVVAILALLSSWAGAVSGQAQNFESYSTSPALSDAHANVFRLYWAFFDRAPDVSGAIYWAEQRDQCISLADTAWSFSNSAEFARRYGSLSNNAYVNLVYLNVLNRAPDDAGRRYWLNLMDSGQLTQPQVMLFFSLSAEFKRTHPFPSDGRTDTSCTPPQAVSPPPPPETFSPPPPDQRDCNPNYSGCVPNASDVDCAGGSGDGPKYVQGPLRVTGRDVYGLDRDRDGIACE